MSRKTYPVRITRAARGIRAQNLRTLAQQVWWARRWIAALEAMRLGARLGRGRKYAVSGQVVELRLEGPHVEAVVQGSRAEPYRVSFDFLTPPQPVLDRLADSLKADPIMPARLLTDDFPTEVEELFHEENVPLFPTGGFTLDQEGKKVYDITMRCTCPDWARPCKHMVAVLFLLGEEVAYRPATLLSLRGLDVGELYPRAPRRKEAFPPVEAPCAATGAAAPFVARLGPVPFWRGYAHCEESLERIAARARPLAQAAARGESIAFE